MLDGRTTMMPFIQCANLHALSPVTQIFDALTKKFSIKLIQILLNSRLFHHRHSNSSHEQIYSSLTIRRCNIIQFDEVNLNNLTIVIGEGALPSASYHHLTPQWRSATRCVTEIADRSFAWKIFDQQDIRFVP